MICVSLNCSVEFEQNRKTHLHCSKQCRERDTRRAAFKPTKQCAWCPERFIPTRAVSRYCSTRCKSLMATKRTRVQYQAIHGIQCALGTCRERFQSQHITQKYCTRKCKEVAQNRRRSNDLAERRRLESLNPACSIRLAYLLDCQLRDVRSQPAAEHGRMFSEPLRKAAA
jgi:hypothetical protein